MYSWLWIYIFVNNIPFLITLSRKIIFTATSHLFTKNFRDILQSFWRIYVFCLKCGFKITTVHTDGEFAPEQEIIVEMSSVPMVNLTSANDNFPRIEQIIWLLKERWRETRYSLPFIMLHFILTTNIVLENVNVLIYSTTMAGILTTISPRAIMTSETLIYKRLLAISFGQYFQIKK